MWQPEFRAAEQNLEEAMSLWEDVKKNLGELYTVTSGKTSELARISTRRYDKFGISREIERQFSELGSFVYSGMKEGRDDLLSDPVAEDLISRIQSLEEELRAKDDEIETIKREHAERQAEAEAAAAGAGATTDAPTDGTGGNAAATVITDPILDAGSDESAILVEPISEAERLDPEKEL